jgi:hypothetical protein
MDRTSGQTQVKLSLSSSISLQSSTMHKQREGDDAKEDDSIKAWASSSIYNGLPNITNHRHEHIVVVSLRF